MLSRRTEKMANAGRGAGGMLRLVGHSLPEGHHDGLEFPDLAESRVSQTQNLGVARDTGYGMGAGQTRGGAARAAAGWCCGCASSDALTPVSEHGHFVVPSATAPGFFSTKRPMINRATRLQVRLRTPHPLVLPLLAFPEASGVEF